MGNRSKFTWQSGESGPQTNNGMTMYITAGSDGPRMVTVEWTVLGGKKPEKANKPNRYRGIRRPF